MTARTVLVFVLFVKPLFESDFMATIIGVVKAVSDPVKPYATGRVVPNTHAFEGVIPNDGQHVRRASSENRW